MGILVSIDGSIESSIGTSVKLLVGKKGDSTGCIDDSIRLGGEDMFVVDTPVGAAVGTFVGKGAETPEGEGVMPAIGTGVGETTGMKVGASKEMSVGVNVRPGLDIGALDGMRSNGDDVICEEVLEDGSIIDTDCKSVGVPVVLRVGPVDDGVLLATRTKLGKLVRETSCWMGAEVGGVRKFIASKYACRSISNNLTCEI